jgi:hypothetical protein
MAKEWLVIIVVMCWHTFASFMMSVSIRSMSAIKSPYWTLNDRTEEQIFISAVY